MKNTIAVAALSFVAILAVRGALAQSTPAPAPIPAALPTFELDTSWPPKLPNGWVMGQMSSVAINRRDHVWLLHRTKDRVARAERERHHALAHRARADE